MSIADTRSPVPSPRRLLKSAKPEDHIITHSGGESQKVVNLKPVPAPRVRSKLKPSLLPKPKLKPIVNKPENFLINDDKNISKEKAMGVDENGNVQNSEILATIISVGIPSLKIQELPLRSLPYGLDNNIPSTSIPNLPNESSVIAKTTTNGADIISIAIDNDKKTCNINSPPNVVKRMRSSSPAVTHDVITEAAIYDIPNNQNASTSKQPKTVFEKVDYLRLAQPRIPVHRSFSERNNKPYLYEKHGAKVQISNTAKQQSINGKNLSCRTESNENSVAQIRKLLPFNDRGNNGITERSSSSSSYTESTTDSGY